MDKSGLSADTEDITILNALRVEALYDNGVAPAVVTLLGALILFFLFLETGLSTVEIIWLVCLFVVAGVRYFSIKLFQESEKKPEEYPFWLNLYLAGVLFSGAIIGSFVYVSDAAVDPGKLYLLAMFVLVLISGSIGIFSVFQRIYYGFTLPLVLPLLICLLSLENETANTLGYLLCIFTFFIFIIQIRTHKFIDQLLMIKLDNRNLLDSYSMDREKIRLLERLNNTRSKQVKELQEALKQCRKKSLDSSD